MPTKLENARNQVRDYANKALAITEDTTFRSFELQKAALTPIEEKLAYWQNELTQLSYVESQRKAFQNVDSPAGTTWGAQGKNGMLGYRGTKSIGNAPAATMTDDDISNLYDSIKSGQNRRVEMKDASTVTNGQQPAQLLPNIVGLRHEPTRILSHIPTTSMDAPSIEFISHVSTTGTATTVLPGGLKPSVTMNTIMTILTAKKIAVTTPLDDEIIQDFDTFRQYVQTELPNLIIDQENYQLLNGDGVDPDLLGLLNQSGILTRAKGSEIQIDTLQSAMADLRVGATYVGADNIVIHPTTWSKIVQLKDSTGKYYLDPNPTAEEASSLWGVPVLQTTAIAQGTALVANLAQGVTGFVRQGLILNSSNSNNDDFQRNRTLFLAEERLNIGVQRPSAISKVTGL